MVFFATAIAGSLALFAAATAPLDPAQSPDPLHRLRARAPASTLLWVETSELGPVLAQGFSHPFIKAVLSDPLIAGNLKRQGSDPYAAADAIQALLGQSPFTLASALGSEGITAGLLESPSGAPEAFFLLRGADPEAMEETLDELEAVLEGLGALQAPSARERRDLGTRVRKSWKLDNAAAAWTREGTLVLAQTWDSLVLCCDVKDRSERLGPARESLLADGTNSLDGAPWSAKTFAWADLDGLDKHAALGDLRAMADEPGTHFVLGPALAYLGRASTLSMGLELTRRGVHFRTLGEGVAVGSGAGSFPDGASPPEPPQADAGVVALGSVHRDFGFLLGHRTELFPPRSQPGIAEGLANLALLTGGPDALDELLAALHPTIKLQSNVVRFPKNTTPDVPLPGVSVSVRVAEPEKNGSRLTSAFQSAISLTNVDQAMKGREGLRLALESVDGVTMTTAKLPPPAEGASVDVRYNLAPACAVVEETFVLGTRGELVEAAIRRMKKSSSLPAPLPSVPTPWVSIDDVLISGPPFARLLDSQRDLLVMQGVLTKGKTQARAEAEFDLVLKLAERVARMQYQSQWQPTTESTRAIRADLHLLFTQ